MNINKLEELISNDYNIVDDIKQIFPEKSKSFKLRKINLKDTNYSSIEIVFFDQNNSKQLIYIIHNKEYVGHSYIVLSYYAYYNDIRNNSYINEDYLKRMNYLFIDSLDNLRKYLNEHINTNFKNF